MKLRDELRSLALALVDQQRPAYTLRNEVLAMKAIFEEAGGKSFASGDLAAGETTTPAGVAISPQMAAMCVDDFARTVQFVRGLHTAIRDAKRKPDRGRAVRVLYAGCGPWATLATPLMTIFSAEEVTFTLLDLHSESLECVHRLTYVLGISDRIDNFVQADAATYRIGDQPDILVIEMLRASVESEPQVAVARNLVQQAPAAVMIPHEIRIDLVLVNASREFSLGEKEDMSRDRVVLESVFVLNAPSLPTASRTVEIPRFDASRYGLMMLTTIHVYGPHYLRDYDSGITLPKAVPHDLNIKPGDKVSFNYEVGTHPRLVARVLPK